MTLSHLLLHAVLATTYATTPIAEYVALGWGSSPAKAQAKYPDLKEQSQGRWCREREVTTECLQYKGGRLEEVRLYFKKSVNIRRALFKQFGDPAETWVSGDEITYKWSRDGFDAVLVQREETASNAEAVPDSRAISFGAVPSVTRQ